MVKRSSSRYARALIELVNETKVNEKVETELKIFKKLLAESKELSDLLLKKVFSGQEKAKALEEILEKQSFQSVTRNFLLYLASQNRFYLFFDIVSEFEQKMDEQKGIAEARVLTAVELSKPLQKQIEEKFEAWSKKKLKVTYHVDPSLIGGIVTKIGNQVFDGSVLTQLHQLKNKLEEAI